MNSEIAKSKIIEKLKSYRGRHGELDEAIDFITEMFIDEPDDHDLIKYTNGFYIGDLPRGKRDGYGAILLDSSYLYLGRWRDDVENSNPAFVVYSSGDIYYGEIRNGKRNGDGIYYYRSHNELVSGRFVNGSLANKYI